MDGRTIPSLGLKRPVTVCMIVAALLVVGAVACMRLPIQLLPSGFTAPFLLVRVSYPNANPNEVLEQVTRPIEENLSTLRGLDSLRTRTHENGARAFLEFDSDVDMDLAYTQVRDRVDRLKAEFPEEVRRVRIWKWNPDDRPIAYYAVSYSGEITNPHRLLEEKIQPRIERIPGVGRLELRGVYPKEIAIDLDRASMAARGANVFDTIERLGRDNFVMSAGTIRHRGREFRVRSLARVENPKELARLRLQGDLRLREVADISYGVQSVGHVHRIDGKLSAGLRVYKEGRANTVEVCNRVRKVFDELEADPKLRSFKFHPLFTQGEVINESIWNLEETALWGGVLATIVLFFFLRRFWMTLVVTFAIPLSILITLVTMFFLGNSLNILSMMGIMLALGMLVDNSVVVTESIARRLSMGGDRTEACIQGTGEVGLAVLLATLTTVIVFLPLVLMQSRFQFFMAAIGRPVCISLLGSLFVALVVIPLASSVLARREGDRPPDPKLIRKGAGLYRRLLHWVLTHRLEATVLACLIAASTAYPFLNVKQTLSDSGGTRRLRIHFEFPESYGLREANDVMSEVEGLLVPKKKELGVKNVITNFEARDGRVTLHLHSPGKGGLSPRALRRKLKKLIPSWPGVSHSLRARDRSDRGAMVSVRLEGKDHDVLLALARKVKLRMEGIPTVHGIEVPVPEGTPEMHISVRRHLAKRYGVPPRRVVTSIAYALRGNLLQPIRMGDEEVDVIIGIRPEDRQYLQQLLNLPIPTAAGTTVPLNRLVAVEERKGPGTISRRNQQTSLTITGETDADSLDEVYAEVERRMATLTLPAGTTWSKGESYVEMRENSDSQTFAIILSIALVFFLMGAFFESILVPFAILFSIPFAFVGVYWFLYATNTMMGVMSGIGTVVLVGIVVNNAIVLLDAVIRRRRAGDNRTAAILNAGEARFRPILMTALTTISGLVPMAWGTSNLVGIPYAPLGRTVIGGLLASTLLTLFLIPLFYTFLDDLSGTGRKLLAGSLKKAGGLKKAPARETVS